MNDSEDTARRPITRERWERLAPLVDAVLEQPPERRRAYIAEISNGDNTLAADLARFVDADGDAPSATRSDSIFEAATRARSSLMERGRLIDTTTDLRAHLQQSLSATYVIEREIDGAGMSRVFVAEERELGRKVVIKVLSPELIEGLSAERFTREIKLAASLQQANIVPVLTAGTATGFPYYTMPFVEGRSLRERLLREGALPINEAVSILRDVARALVFAHGRGIIHRDIKPGNILLSDRTAVVTDFGIAKALGAARTGDADPAISRVGTGLGTPAYMAPEQAAGEPNLDHRADIYSFGCVAYELLTGKPPFVGTSHDVIAAHFRESPRPVTELRPDVPVAVADLVTSCLEKKPAQRPQSAEEVLLRLDGAASVGTARPGTSRRLRRVAIASTLVAAAVGVVFVARTMRTTDASPAKRLIVLPIENAADDSLSYVGFGIDDDIVRRLHGIGGMQAVLSAGKSSSARAVDNGAVLSGSAFGRDIALRSRMTRSGDSLAVTTELVDLATRRGRALGTFAFASANYRDAASRMAAAIVGVLFRARLPEVPRATNDQLNSESYRLTIAGWDALLNQNRRDVAKEFFDEAIQKDAKNARAYAGLSSIWAGEAVVSTVPFAEGAERAEAAGERALAYDSLEGTPWANLGVLRALRNRRVADGEPLVDKAVALDPANPELYLIRFVLYRHAWQWDKARDATRMAARLDPLSSRYIDNESLIALCRGQPEEALRLSREALVLDPTSQGLHQNMARALARLRRWDEATAQLHLAELGPGSRPSAARERADLSDTLHGEAGYWALTENVGRATLKRLEARAVNGGVDSVLLAVTRIYAGDLDGGMTLLEHQAPTGTPGLYRLPCQIQVDRMRDSARFQKLLTMLPRWKP